MDNTGSIVRKNLHDLSRPMEMRELNRQLDWIWKSLLGGLTIKALSPETTRKIISSSVSEAVNKADSNASTIIANTIVANNAYISSLIADEITANNANIGYLVAKEIDAEAIETKTLKAVLAEMMVAQIGIANIDYAKIVDMYSNRIFTDVGLAGKFRMDKLEVSQAQIVDLIVNSFRLVSDDGKVYKVAIDKYGNLTTEYLADEAEWFADGKIPDGYSAVASSLTVGDVTAGRLYVSGAADVMKLTAKYLVADSGWINELTTMLIQSEIGSKLTIKGDLGIDMTVADILKGLRSDIKQNADSIEFVVGKTDEISHIYRQEEFPDGTADVKPGDMLVIPSTGQQYQAVQSGAIRFAMDADGNLYYELDGDGSLKMQGFDLYADGFTLPVDERGEVTGVPYVWELVQDSQIANTANDALSIANAALSQADFQRVVRIDDAGLHVGDNLTDYEVLLDSASVNVVAAGVRVSTFSDKFIRLDNMQIRKVRGGLAISVYNG